MRTYNLNTSKKQRLNTNCYINLEYIKDYNRLFNMFNSGIVDTNITDVNKFISDLVNYELESSNGKRADTLNNYGVLLTFLLEKEEKPGNLVKLSREIAKNYGNLPYISCITTQGKGNYLQICFSERYYYPNGQIREVKAKKDSYRDAKTGKACNKEDANAVLWRKKGDIISSSIETFSSKVRYFRYASEQQFYNFIDKLKLFFIDLCKSILKAVNYTGITFKKYVLKVLAFKQKGNARLWNRTFNRMEDRFNYAVECLEQTNYLQDAKKQLDSLFIKYNTLLHANKQFYDNNKKFYIPLKYGKISFSIDFNTSYRKAKEDTNLLLDRFNKELDTIVFSYLPQF